MSATDTQIGRNFATRTRSALVAQADPERAAGQQRYMKSAMPFHGVTQPQLRAIVRRLLTGDPLPDRETWLAILRTLWDEATHREQRYAALAVLRTPREPSWLRPDEALLGLVRQLIVTGAWWDLVDETAHVVGTLLRADPAGMTALMRTWSREQNLWLRRVSIIGQLGFKGDTDVELLSDSIAGSLDDPDFFARKAIGWALREYAKTDPDWVRGYVEAHAVQLSGLSKREALKHLDR